jgi:hypothetical protein
MQRAFGTAYTVGGSINLAMGTFSATSTFSSSQALIYAIDCRTDWWRRSIRLCRDTFNYEKRVVVTCGLCAVSMLVFHAIGFLTGNGRFHTFGLYALMAGLAVEFLPLFAVGVLTV